MITTVLVAGCMPKANTPIRKTPTAIAVLPPESFSDPFAYCQAVVDADKPDSRYTGEALPAPVLQGFLDAIGASPEARADENFTKMTRWRCMGGQVFACNFGANLPCETPADTNKEPNAGMREYCAQNPSAEFIPMVYTGHATIYNWRCKQGQPFAGDLIMHPDERGFIKEIWYLVAPKAE